MANKNHHHTNGTEFISLAAHQLLTPLSAIGWYTEMLLSSKSIKTKKKQKEFLQEIYRSNQRMVRLVISLLNISRIEMGKLGVLPEMVDLFQISEMVLQDIKDKTKEKLPSIKTVYHKDSPRGWTPSQGVQPLAISLFADPKIIEVILRILLTNAINYTSTSGKVELIIKRKAKNILIEVSDDGIGIPRKQQDRIFEKLFRADNAREKDAYGVGLGLYLVKLILQIVGGKIWFKSVQGKGSSFFVELPASGMKKRVGEKGLV